MKYDPAVDVWAPLSVAAVGALFAAAAERWWLSGGLAIEHRLGRPVRAHGDVDVSVLRSEAWRYWRFPRVTLPWERAVSFVDPLPTGSLATQLLFKSRRQQAKDNQDLAAAWPFVPEADREWLVKAVRLAHPDSPWLLAAPFS